MNINEIVELVALTGCSKEKLDEAIESIERELEEIENDIKEIEYKLDGLGLELPYAYSDEAKLELLKKYGTESGNDEHLMEVQLNKTRLLSILSQLQEKRNNYKRFNKMTFIDNVKYLLKSRPDIKLGQIEKEAGISLGYMSRLAKEDNKADPSVEFVLVASQMLGVSLETLLTIDMSTLTPTESYLVSFLEKIEKDTKQEKLEWDIESADYLNSLEPDINEYVDHPLMNYTTYEVEDENGEYHEIQRVLFKSHSFGTDTWILNDGYGLKLKNNSRLYLMKVNKEDDIHAIEMWMDAGYNRGLQFLLDSNSPHNLGVLLERLYELLTRQMSGPRVKKDVREIIDAFMQDDLGTDQELFYIDPNLPFT